MSHNINSTYPVIVIGGGHSGCEAAYACANIFKNRGLKEKVALVTLRGDNLGQMSCNPAIGGLGKGIIVKEIDAMGGLMGFCADASAIHCKTLGEKKGSAVQGPRVQSDRSLYQKAVLNVIYAHPNIEVIVGSVENILIENSEVKGVSYKSDNAIHNLYAKEIILTTGTFLSGIILQGEMKKPAGRIGEPPSLELSKSLYGCGFKMGKLKTGTPARLNKHTINFDILERQEGGFMEPFSCMTKEITNPQVTCYITHTNPTSHKVMTDNSSHSMILSNKVTSLGPRYCPSIEDKIKRFPNKDEHRIFLEPEGLESDLIYPNGISTSMPMEIQTQFINSIRGLEKAEIIQGGYAVEYDFVCPTELHHTLETKRVRGLFFAGQINGTTGYEEAAGQGLVAGINSARQYLGLDLQEFSRTQSYIGVMIDDLVTKGITEPYRMFTSRSEYRLLLRPDNADIRMTPMGISLDTVTQKQAEMFTEKQEKIDRIRSSLKAVSFSPNTALQKGISVSMDGKIRTAYELIGMPMKGVDFNPEEFVASLGIEFSKPLLMFVANESKYEPYIKRQLKDIDVLQSQKNIIFPENIDYNAIESISAEVRNILIDKRPKNLFEANKIQGITPAAIINLLLHFKKYC